jgi:hypothetical protein
MAHSDVAEAKGELWRLGRYLNRAGQTRISGLRFGSVKTGRDASKR